MIAGNGSLAGELGASCTVSTGGNAFSWIFAALGAVFRSLASSDDSLSGNGGISSRTVA